MKHVVLVLTALLVLTLSAAGEDKVIPIGIYDTVIVPDGSPFAFLSHNKNGDVRFTGKMRITGHWYYGDEFYNDGPGVELEMYFYPDQESWARLPRLKLRGQPAVLFLRDTKPFVKAVVSPRTAARLKANKKAGYASGTAAIWVDQLVVGIECDGPSFGGRLVALEPRPTVLALGSLPGTSC